MILGVIADDFTGATDVASMLVRSGMRTVQSIGLPEAAHAPDGTDAVVISLKSRTAPVQEAVADSLAALRWLQAAGARQFYFKYCSTFDSTPQGNIGPVAEALMAALGTDFTVACPALPENGRTVYQGHLFVGAQLLSDSGMRDHPLTPMTDANLVRVLQAQVSAPVGLAAHDLVRAGSAALRDRLAQLRAQGHRFAVVDAITNEDLHALAAACEDLPLLTAGSGLALGLPATYAARGWLQSDASASRLDTVPGPAAVVAGSCSQATRAQVAHWRSAGLPAHAIDPLALARGVDMAGQALAAWRRQPGTPHLFYATAEPEAVREAQQALGVQKAGELVERCLAQVARTLVDEGVGKLVVAGGETSGAVVQALGVRQLRIGPTIATGVPWTQVEGRELLLALKSGNFGGPAFFTDALAMVA